MEKPNFFQNKDALLQTLSQFDTDTKEEDTVGLCEATSEIKNHTFFVQVFLEALCGIIEPEEENRHQLFNGLYSQLVHSNFLNQRIILDDLLPVRRQLANKFTELVSQVHSKITPSPKLDHLLLPQNAISSVHQKYIQTFDEIEVIATGGFGIVCKARHKVDEVIYAVKKIIFKYKSDSDYFQVIREVKSIATLNHLNVVSYNNAWIEHINSGYTTESEESSSSNSDKYMFSSFQPSTILKDAAKKTKDSTFTYSHNSKSLVSNRNSVDKFDFHISSSKSNKVFVNDICKGSFSNHTFLTHSENDLVTSSETLSSFDQLKIVKKNNLSQSFKESQKCLAYNSSWNLINMNVKVMLCIQMEFCNCDLRLWLNNRAKGQTLPFQMEITNIFKHIVSGVAHIHSKSIIHRDLKPQNIFFSTKDNVMKIGDFGLATLGQCSADSKGVISSHYSSNLGTIPYSAPEQRNRHSYDSKVDIYSLGIILIELLIHFHTQMEFSKTINEVINGIMPSELCTNWPQYINILANLLQKDPKLRMSAKEILSQPLLLDHFEIEQHVLLREIGDLKKTLAEKNTLIQQLELKIQKQSVIIRKQAKKIEVLQKNLHI